MNGFWLGILRTAPRGHKPIRLSCTENSLRANTTQTSLSWKPLRPPTNNSRGLQHSSQNPRNLSHTRPRNPRRHSATLTSESNEVETRGLDSAKSLAVTKILGVISESLGQLVTGNAFLQWCETRLVGKLTESGLESCKLFFESSYSKGLSLGSITSEVADRTPDQIAHDTITIIEGDPSFRDKWHEWRDNNELPKASRELMALVEALRPLTRPLVAIRRRQVEVEMQNTEEIVTKLSPVSDSNLAHNTGGTR